MKRFAFNLSTGKNFVKLDEPLTTHSSSRMIIRNIDVFWECENLKENTIVNYGSDITFTKFLPVDRLKANLFIFIFKEEEIKKC